MTYRIIALDLDGTLLDRQKRILPESLAALADARAQALAVTGKARDAAGAALQRKLADADAGLEAKAEAAAEALAGQRTAAVAELDTRYRALATGL